MVLNVSNVCCAGAHEGSSHCRRWAYERVAMQQWLLGQDTSPVTHLKLKHTRLVPNVLIRGMLALQEQEQV